MPATIFLVALFEYLLGRTGSGDFRRSPTGLLKWKVQIDRISQELFIKLRFSSSNPVAMERAMSKRRNQGSFDSMKDFVDSIALTAEQIAAIERPVVRVESLVREPECGGREATRSSI